MNALNESLYEGHAGIALYFLELYKKTQIDSYLEAYKKSINTAINESKYNNIFSAYSCRLSVVFPILSEISYFGTSEHQFLIEVVFQELNNKVKEIESLDWISGLAGILALAVTSYEVLGDSFYLDIAEVIANEVLHKQAKEKFDKVGLGHGCTGLALALFKIYQHTPLEIYKSTAIEILNREKQIMNSKDYEKQSKWCWGTTGIGMGKIEILKIYKNNEILIDIYDLIEDIELDLKADDCICHGNFGDIEFLNQLQIHQLGSNTERILEEKINSVFLYKNINNQFSVKRLPEIESFDLFTGLSGIGYELLRLDSPTAVSNVYTLTINKP
ncbi:hypothetical protein J7E73_10490 [Paenibacillus albidus]|uniref:lanthionine synthetase LanC family protein n=1 Tax=Paenibacillus albidus TaxID=2041023 RepID=UPI001BE647D3|nr:lanthionine synthetase LanC family protein [Paenibacillus albidus]MBT2289554.1 hypothetical protein [Paenibacillus albidus]